MNYANRRGWTDVYPYEVLKTISPKCLEVRQMDAFRDLSVTLDFHVGGFSAHCSNQRDQKWDITVDPTRSVERIRLQKDGIWRDKHGQRFTLNDHPIRYYDYNF